MNYLLWIVLLIVTVMTVNFLLISLSRWTLNYELPEMAKIRRNKKGQFVRDDTLRGTRRRRRRRGRKSRRSRKRRSRKRRLLMAKKSRRRRRRRQTSGCEAIPNGLIIMAKKRLKSKWNDFLFYRKSFGDNSIYERRKKFRRFEGYLWMTVRPWKV